MWLINQVIFFSVLLVASWSQIDPPDAPSYDWDTPTALDEYVHLDDGAFIYELVANYSFERATLLIYNMTSQRWFDDTFSSRPLWWHFVGIAIPDDLRITDHAVLTIVGGSNNDNEVPPPFDSYGVAAVQIANDTGMISAYVSRIPNQPIRFYDDPTNRSRSEDSQIAYTWRIFFDTLDTPNFRGPEVASRFPQTKGAKKALDLVNIVAQQQVGLNIEKFIVMGASKRGWTAWSLAATDGRVVALLPLVFSLLNLIPVVQKHFMNMDGAWSWAFEPYYNEGLTRDLLTPKAEELAKYEDPYRYRSRLTLPKLLIVASGDEFFLLDDSHAWWNSMPGRNRIMMNPNAQHILAPHYLKIYDNIVLFIELSAQGLYLPYMDWTKSQTPEGGLVQLETDIEPIEIRAMVAITSENDTRRDYRIFSADSGEPGLHGIRFLEEPVTPVGDLSGRFGYHYEHRTNTVEGEWMAHFIEAVFTGPNGRNFTLTTEVNVVPNNFPRGPCNSPDDCYGYLI